MQELLDKMDIENCCYNNVKSTIDKIKFAWKQIEEDSFGHLRSLDIAGLSSSLLKTLTAFTEGKVSI